MRRIVVSALPSLCRWRLVRGFDDTSATKREELLARMNAAGLVAPEQATREVETAANAGPLHRARAVAEHGTTAREAVGRYAKLEGRVRTETLEDITIEES